MKKKDLNIFSKIENIRSKNNKNWMNLLRLSYESNPNKTLSILSKFGDGRIYDKVIRKKGTTLIIAEFEYIDNRMVINDLT